MKLIIGNRCFCPGLITSLIALLFFCLFLSLGFWQLDRAEQKRMLFADFEKRQSSPVLELSDNNIESFKEGRLMWRPVSLYGEFLEQYQVLLDNQVEEGQAGYFVYTPFKLDQSDDVVLVNRGWMSTGRDRGSSPDLIKTYGPVNITGIVKAEPKTGMLLENAIPENIEEEIYRVQKLYIKDIQDLLKIELLPYIVRLSPASDHGYYRKWQSPGSGVSMHLGYAFQWFAFATALMAIYLITNVKKIKQDIENE